jgi:hypothetical protein
MEFTKWERFKMWMKDPEYALSVIALATSIIALSIVLIDYFMNA